MAVSLSPFAGAGWQFFDNNGVILSGGKLYTYAAGTTSLATTYTSSSGSTANTNPIILNSSGRLANEIWLTTGLNYKFILKTSADVLIGTWDNIPAGTTDVADLQAALASSTGAGMIGYIANDIGTAVATTVQAKLRETVSVKDFGAVGDGVTDDTAAFENAFATGKSVYAPAGTYKLTNCSIPGIDGFILFGDGPNNTIFIAGASNTPILRKEPVAGVVQYGRIGDFSLKAHASGSTGTAFDVSGFRSVIFFNIFGLSNGTLGFQSLFDVSASPYLTYGCVWDKCGLAAQTGWTNVWLFNNRGSGSGGNANINTIRDPWIYANTGLSIAIDAARSTLLNIIGGIIEANTGATAIRSGQRTNVIGVWFELNGTDISYGNLVDGVGNTGVVEYCYFSTAHNVDFTGVTANTWFCNTEAGVQTFTNNNGTNIKVNPQIVIPSAPTIARVSGATGTPALISATPNSLDLFGRITYHLRYSVTPSAASYQELSLTPPANYAIENAVVGAIRNANGVPATASLGPTSTGQQFYIGYAGADAHEIIVRVTIKPA